MQRKPAGFQQVVEALRVPSAEQSSERARIAVRYAKVTPNPNGIARVCAPGAAASARCGPAIARCGCGSPADDRGDGEAQQFCSACRAAWEVL